MPQYSNENDDPVEGGLANVGSIQHVIEYGYLSESYEDGMKAKLLKQVDQKLDDGKSTAGKMRSMCVDFEMDTDSAEYDDKIKKNGNCLGFLYAI